MPDISFQFSGSSDLLIISLIKYASLIMAAEESHKAIEEFLRWQTTWVCHLQYLISSVEF